MSGPATGSSSPARAGRRSCFGRRRAGCGLDRGEGSGDRRRLEHGRKVARGRSGTCPDPPTVGWDRHSRSSTPEKVTSVAFAPDGSRLATGGKRGSATIWSVDGEKLVELEGHSAEITDIAFSADGSRVATASRDETARVWDTGTGRQLLELAPHRDDVTSVAFSPDGSSCSPRAGITMRDCGMRRPGTGPSSPLALRRGCRCILQPRRPLDPHGRSRDGRPLAARCPRADSSLRIRRPQATITSAVFDPSGRYVLTAATDRDGAQS